MKFYKLSFLECKNIIKKLSLPIKVDENLTYKAYNKVYELINDLFANNLLPYNFYIDPYEVFYYVLGEISYSISSNINGNIFDDNFILKVSNFAADKYLSLRVFTYNETKMANKYFPPISSLILYSNFILKKIEKYEQDSPQKTLIIDLLKKSFSLINCILNLLLLGYETEAFASWRTLHECECTLFLLDKYQEPLIQNYLKHMKYGIAFKDEIADKKEQDNIFINIKEEMKDFNLKSKDIKKYIEYGWLSIIPSVKIDPNFKFNFRDGLEKLCDLSKYNDTYQLSSEILHSTPLLIYNDKKYFYSLTLINLYETFFRLEKIFHNVFIKTSKDIEKEKYLAFKNMYYPELEKILKLEKENSDISIKIKREAKIF